MQKESFECIFIGGESHDVKILFSRVQRQYEKFDVFYHPRCMPAFENENDEDLQFSGLTLELTELNLKYFHRFFIFTVFYCRSHVNIFKHTITPSLSIKVVRLIQLFGFDL